MTKVHFYQGHSRLGLANPPIGTKALNIGVEDGPSAILTTEFLNQFNAQIDSQRFSFPDQVVDLNQTLARELAHFQHLIEATLADDEVPVVIGGEHSLSFASINALLKRAGDPTKVAYIQIDSHGDMNLAADSPTGNFHGMYLRPFLGDFDLAEFKELVPLKLVTSNVIFIGNLDLDPAEKIFFEQNNIRQINKKELIATPDTVHQQLADFINHRDYLHLNIDIDAFDASLVSATGLPAENGLMWEQVEPLLKLFKHHPQLSIDLVEVNPHKAGAASTVALAQRILKILLNG